MLLSELVPLMDMRSKSRATDVAFTKDNTVRRMLKQTEMELDYKNSQGCEQDNRQLCGSTEFLELTRPFALLQL